jgi:hypothetical protein
MLFKEILSLLILRNIRNPQIQSTWVTTKFSITNHPYGVKMSAAKFMCLWVSNGMTQLVGSGIKQSGHGLFSVKLNVTGENDEIPLPRYTVPVWIWSWYHPNGRCITSFLRSLYRLNIMSNVLFRTTDVRLS